jgi:hypothetical protein
VHLSPPQAPYSKLLTMLNCGMTRAGLVSCLTATSQLLDCIWKAAQPAAWA